MLSRCWRTTSLKIPSWLRLRSLETLYISARRNRFGRLRSSDCQRIPLIQMAFTRNRPILRRRLLLRGVAFPFQDLFVRQQPFLKFFNVHLLHWCARINRLAGGGGGGVAQDHEDRFHADRAVCNMRAG